MRRRLLGLVLFAACSETPLVPAYSAADAVTVECAEGDFTLASVAPQVMLVLDRSGSMGSSFGTSTRWATTVAALEVALPPVDATMQLGLFLFPAQSLTGQECTVSSTPAFWPSAGQVGAILSSLRSTSMVGGTPTAAALDAAAAALDGTVPRAMVLATDGLPNCNAALNAATCACPSQGCGSAARCIDDARTLERLSAWAEAGIPTFIIGIGDEVQSTSLLDAMAKAGGRPFSGAHAYAAASSPATLQQAFIDIRDQLSACTFVTASVPDQGGAMTVWLDGVPVPHDASGTQGWAWSAEARGELVLRGDWCARAIAAEHPVVRIAVTCGDDDGGIASAVVE